MAYDLLTIASPKREDGENDQRYTRLIKDVISNLPDNVKVGLEEGYTTLVKNRNSVYPYLQQFIIALLERASKEDEWKLQGIRSCIKEIFAEYGYSNSQVSKIAGALEKRFELRSNGSQAIAWYDTQPLKTQYALSRLNADGFSRVWTTESEHGSKEVTSRQVEELISKYPKENRKFRQGRQVGSSNNKPTDTSSWRDNKFEEAPQNKPASQQTINLPSNSASSSEASSQEDQFSKLDPTERKVMKLVEALEDISVDDIYARDDLIDKLKPVSQTIEGLLSCVQTTSGRAFRR